MRAFANLSTKEELESEIIQEQETPSKMLSGWQKMVQKFLTAVVSKRELRVWSTSDRSGNTEWHAYDPETGRSIHVASETEMRHWIEQSYYH